MFSRPAGICFGFVVICLLFTVAVTQNWRGNIESYKGWQRRTCRYCTCRYRWGCSQWRNNTCEAQVDYYRCQSGWRHNGDYNCRILIIRAMSVESSKLREMYPDIEPYDTGMLQVSDIHQVYYEQSGKKTGNPVIFLHGGPGGGTSPRDRTFFDPEVYRIILMDQRGAGKSTPAAELRENTTWDLVADIEKLREKLGIEKWVVFGGSWGSTLSLAYAETHPGKVKALILRGIFTLRRRELLWYYQDGASFIFPDAFEDYVKLIPEVERGDLMGAFYRRLTSGDEKVQLECARAWSKWEMATSRLYVDQKYMARADVDIWALQFARIECHYFVHGGFFERDDQLLANVDKIRHIPMTIVQGRYDLVCPMDTAWKLHRALPEAEFHIVPDAGHSNKEPGTQSRLLDACDKYKHL